jgi:hypothetical protein
MHFERRLRKLEARLTDRSGVVPHTEAWWDYWIPRVDRLISGEEPGEPGYIPLEVCDYIVASGRGSELLSRRS